jgi:hypothetical protein
MSEFQYLAAIGKRGGLVSRRELTKSHARQMVAIRELKRVAIKAGKPWASAQSQTVKAQVTELIHHKPLMMHHWRRR